MDRTAPSTPTSGLPPAVDRGAIQRWLPVVRIVVALAVLSATVYQLWRFEQDIPGFRSANFFSYFTYESAILSSVVLMLYGLGQQEVARSRWGDWFRGAAVVYMATTGIVYQLLLADLRPDDGTASQWWVNLIVHQALPIAMVLDWLIDPPRIRLVFRRAIIWLAYPLAFLVYSLIRGEFVGWYPYGFIDPTDGGGWAKVLSYSVGITVAILVLTWLVVAIGNQLRTRRDRVIPA